MPLICHIGSSIFLNYLANNPLAKTQIATRYIKSSILDGIFCVLASLRDFFFIFFSLCWRRSVACAYMSFLNVQYSRTSTKLPVPMKNSYRYNKPCRRRYLPAVRNLKLNVISSRKYPGGKD
jgi:hypothetical protein